jgi:hypothetical protein
LLVRIQPEEPILQQLAATTETVSDERAVFLPSKTQETGAILQVLPLKNPVKHRMVNEPDQLNLFPSQHSMHMWFAERSTAFGKRCVTNRDEWE